MPTDRAQDTEAIRAALMVDGYGSPPRHTAIGQEALSALDRLVARLEAAERALAALLDCKGSFNGTVSQYGGDPAVCTKCEAMARAALAAAAPGETTLAEPGIGESLAGESPRNTDAGRSELAARSLHAPGSANAETRCVACGFMVVLDSTHAAPAETEQTP